MTGGDSHHAQGEIGSAGLADSTAEDRRTRSAGALHSQTQTATPGTKRQADPDRCGEREACATQGDKETGGRGGTEAASVTPSQKPHPPRQATAPPSARSHAPPTAQILCPPEVPGPGGSVPSPLRRPRSKPCEKNQYPKVEGVSPRHPHPHLV